MKTKCYSVRLDSLIQISDKCYLATAFDIDKKISMSEYFKKINKEELKKELKKVL